MFFVFRLISSAQEDEIHELNSRVLRLQGEVQNCDSLERNFGLVAKELEETNKTINTEILQRQVCLIVSTFRSLLEISLIAISC